MSEEKKILPSSFVKISYEVYDEENNLLYSTSIRREGEGEPIERPVIIKIGDKEVFFEDELVGVKEGEELDIELPPEKAFGKRDPQKILRIPLKRLRAMTGKKDFHVGEELYTQDNRYFGRIIYVGSREVTVDSNHPLAGKTLRLKAKIYKVVNPEDPEGEKVDIILERHFGQFYKDIKQELVGEELKIIFPPEALAQLNLDTMLRYIYIPRRAASEELIRETSLKKVTYVETFSSEIQLAPPEEETKGEEALAKAEALGELTREEEDGEKE